MQCYASGDVSIEDRSVADTAGERPVLRRTLRFSESLGEEGETRWVELRPKSPTRVRDEKGKTLFMYKLLVSSQTGEIVTYFDEDHGFDVNMVTDWIGHDEDGRDQYEILHGVETTDFAHEKCDLSVESG